QIQSVSRRFGLCVGLSQASWCFLLWIAAAVPAVARQPNVILIVTDNHGAWTLGCYGNPDIRTPHIDQLAAEGVLFTQAYASNAVCSPTRATLLTGLIPSQHGVHCYLRREPLQVGPNAKSTVAEYDTLPQILHESGYTCGLVGKWHLGDNTHPQEGFSYWITMPHGATSTFYNAEIIQDGQIRRYPGYLTDLWTKHALKFIDQSVTGDKPFFLFLSYNGPYGLGGMLERDAKNRHADYYADKILPSFPRHAPHPWLFNNREYLNNVTSIRRYAAELGGVDDGVGEVLGALQRHNIDRETLVIFTADQGWVGGQGGFWGMGDHTRPLTASDGMLRIPLIFRQPGHIATDKRCDRMVSNYDVMPSILGYLGLSKRMAKSPASPGRDFSPVLSGEPVAWDDVVFYEFENVRAIRTPRWKYIRRIPDGPDELYDMQKDPAEQKNLIDSEDVAERRRKLCQQLDQFFARYAEPKYDLWNGGGSKTSLIVMKSPVLDRD
ncbi:MAG: sulfatase-like hydrolase/transferase, partial [Planctomycetes bacterium]|nr:sulfatase-like hydrolase/transferase [Planctomycetota bacterium]